MFEKEGYALVGAAMEVYNTMGPGYLEEVYQECLEIELTARGIPFVSQPALALSYKDRSLNTRYRPDLYDSDGIVTELKAVKAMTNIEQSQLPNYMKGCGKAVGYLLKFGHPDALEWKRFVL